MATLRAKRKLSGRLAGMGRPTVVYGAAFALGAFVLQWLENQYAIRLFSTELYIVLIALLFTGVGIWIGAQVAQRPQQVPFERNERAIESLGLTAKELEVIALLAEGGSTQDIAKRLFVSTSTITSHLVSLYRKLDVSRRTQAIRKAKTLKIIP
jgi:DNA-binding NarL/FixJ family response regulator